jgi:catalase
MMRELGREYPELDDPSVFEHMVAMTVAQMEPVSGQLRRGQHAKATGCVTAEFRIANAVPPELSHGIFSQPGRAYSAMVRFSNSQSTFEKDSVGTVRGLAIKLLDVAGARAMPGDGDTSQDFLMIDHPVFPFPDPKTYSETISRKNIPLVGSLVAAAHLILLERDELKILNEMKGKGVVSPLEIKYWSGTPFRLGPATGDEALAVKYSVTSHQTDRTTPSDHPEDLADDYITRALTAALASGEAVFDFKVQRQKDANKQPVEDVSVEWSEKDSEPITVATLRIPTQKVEAAGKLAAQCEALSFNPWHALAEHRPIGGMNRLRRAVYEASVKKRTSQ